MAAAFAIGGFVTMMISGGAGIPAQVAELQQAEERAKRLCRQTRWNLHRTEQMKILTKDVQKSYGDYYGPALDMAQTAQKTWQLSQTALAIDKKIMYVNVGVLAILMIVYVLLTYFCLFKKRQTLQDAFAAVYDVHFQD